MEEIINDNEENLKQTDSQKSVATSFMYSLDFTDSSSEKNNSSGMDTYVLECDSESNESPRSKNNVIIKNKAANNYVHIYKNSKSCKSTTFNGCSIVAQEIFTQTSKTIIELAANDGALIRSVDCNNLETQTSMISVRKNKTIEYNVEMTAINSIPNNNDTQNDIIDLACEEILNKSLEDYSSKLQTSENEDSISDKLIEIINEDSAEGLCEELSENGNNSDFDCSADTSDIEQDSLMEPTRNKTINDNDEEYCDTPKSVDRDVAELYTKLYETMDIETHRPLQQEKPDFGYLTPLSEEPVTRRNSIIDFTPTNVINTIEEDKDVLFTNKSGVKIKVFPKEQIAETEHVKLPPIKETQNSKKASLNFLFSLTPNNLQLGSRTLPCVSEEKKDDRTDRWELSARELASGEGTFINGRNDIDRGTFGTVTLPPIQIANALYKIDLDTAGARKTEHITPELQSSIDVKDKIKELKMSHKGWNYTNYSLQLDVVVTLEDIPAHLEKFWNVITEYRIADLLRQVSVHVESPRTQVARTACTTLAVILKYTNYTKKPEFYEAVTILLTKTGSFNRPVRRAANVALDDIVCGVDLSHAITAICIHGASHKSPLVRCAAARLLVVCCALGGGGRELLRARPQTAACARKHVLRSLAMLLEDKSTEARKYAERLYSMLRPLSSFEAYYISDVDVELASRQIKKYDQLLLCGPPEPR